MKPIKHFNKILKGKLGQDKRNKSQRIESTCGKCGKKCKLIHGHVISKTLIEKISNSKQYNITIDNEEYSLPWYASAKYYMFCKGCEDIFGNNERLISKLADKMLIPINEGIYSNPQTELAYQNITIIKQFFKDIILKKSIIEYINKPTKTKVISEELQKLNFSSIITPTYTIGIEYLTHHLTTPYLSKAYTYGAIKTDENKFNLSFETIFLGVHIALINTLEKQTVDIIADNSKQVNT